MTDDLMFYSIRRLQMPRRSNSGCNNVFQKFMKFELHTFMYTSQQQQKRPLLSLHRGRKVIYQVAFGIHFNLMHCLNFGQESAPRSGGDEISTSDLLVYVANGNTCHGNLSVCDQGNFFAISNWSSHA